MYLIRIVHKLIKLYWHFIYYRDEHKQSKTMIEAKCLEEDTFTPPIYNLVSSSTNPLSWGEFTSLNIKHGQHIPTVKAVNSEDNNLNRIFDKFLLHVVMDFCFTVMANYDKTNPEQIRI